jgi:hypothetical protein
MKYILTRDQELAEVKFRAPPSHKSRRYALPAPQFYAGLKSRAEAGREERKLMWRTFLSSDNERA